nr:Domain X [Ipomoea trifida]
MKEAIRMVLESIYDSEFPDTSHFRSGRGCHSVLRRIKEEWGTSRWFLEFDIRKCFHTIDRHRLIPIFKEEIDDPKFFYPIHKVFSAGRLVGGEKGPYSVPHSVLLSALPGNIYLHKLDQEIGRIRQKYEIPIVQRIRSVLLRTGRIDDQENSGEEASFNAPQDNRAIIVGRVKSIQRKAAFHSLVSSWHTPPQAPPGSGGTRKRLSFSPLRSTTIAARSTVEYLGTVIREVPPRTTPIQFLRELEKRLRVKHRIHITACHLRSAIHSKFRNLGNSISIKQLTKGMSGTFRLLDAVQLAETLGTAGIRSPQVSVLWGTVKHIRQGSRGISLLHSSGRSKVPSDVQQAVSRSGMRARKFALYTPAGRKAAGEGGGHWARSISSEFPIQIEAPIKKILRRLRDRGLISRRRPWPIHVACLTNVSDGDIVNWSAGIAISPLSYYRCRDNLYQVRTIVDYQIRWSAIFTPAHKHKSSARNIILKYSKDSHIVNQEGGKTLAEFSNSIELGKLGSGQDPNNKEHSTTSLV